MRQLRLHTFEGDQPRAQEAEHGEPRIMSEQEDNIKMCVINIPGEAQWVLSQMVTRQNKHRNHFFPHVPRGAGSDTCTQNQKRERI